jgi:catechol 2,3-dioxygenase-like lactoylglutathione lyase family enzyme
VRLDHVTILTEDVEGSTEFFREVLGLEPGSRPAFSFSGAWLYAGQDALVHLKAPNPLDPRSRGALEHVAFATAEFEAVVARLGRLGIPHRVQALPDGSRRQCFFSDPNGVLVEVTSD